MIVVILTSGQSFAYQADDWEDTIDWGFAEESGSTDDSSPIEDILLGDWIWPCPFSRVISSNFGKRNYASSPLHKGIDIACPIGTPIYAAKSGRIYSYCNKYGNDEKVWSGGMSSFGNYVSIKHDDGSFSIYAHLSNFGMVTMGRVDQGQIIGYSGDSGSSSGPHLHFQARSTSPANGWSNANGLLNMMPTEACIAKNGIEVRNELYEVPDGWSTTRTDYLFMDEGVSYDRGSCGKSLQWMLDGTGTLIISGSGAMFDYDEEIPPWFDYAEYIQTIAITKGVKSIGKSAFEGCDKATIVILPASITSIASDAFDDCYSLESVHYLGTRKDWKKIEFGEDNQCLLYSDVHCSDDALFVAITLTATDGGGVIGGGEYAIGDTVELYASPDLGYYFVGWYQNDQCISTDNLFSFEVKENTSLLAKFAKDVHIPFPDVPSDAWFAEAVAWASENDIIVGYPDGTFAPNESCNRAQIVTLLWRVEGSPPPISESLVFSDVYENQWFSDAVFWAIESEVTNGRPDGTFGPYDLCNRAEAVTFLWRAAGNPKAGNSETSFGDVASGEWFSEPISWAATHGIAFGVSDGKFDPTAVCSRAQIVTLLWRAFA